MFSYKFLSNICRRGLLITMAACLANTSSASVHEAGEGEPGAEGKGRPVSLYLVVDGSEGWYSAAVDSLPEAFRRDLDPGAALRVARFDADEQDSSGQAAAVARKFRVPIPNRTPFRDAVHACIEQLASSPPENVRAIVAVVHEESYPSGLSTERLLESLRDGQITLYPIRLARKPQQGVVRRLARVVVDAVVWLGDALADAPRVSYHETSDLLGALSPDGVVCNAPDEQHVSSCVHDIAAQIRKSAEEATR